jgi:hypothetical protein
LASAKILAWNLVQAYQLELLSTFFSRQILNEKKKRWPRRFAKASA